MHRWLRTITLGGLLNSLRFSLLLGLLLGILLGGCRGAPTEPALTPTVEQPVFPADTPTQPVPTATEPVPPTQAPPTVTETPLAVFPEATSTSESVTETPPVLTDTPFSPSPTLPAETPAPVSTDTSVPLPTDTPGSSGYPPPVPTSTSIYSGYPLPVATSTSIYWDYPEPAASATPYSQATLLPGVTGTPPGPTATWLLPPSLTPTLRILPTRPTLTGPTPTDFVGKPFSTPQPAGSTVTLWHGWTGQKALALDRIIDSFQDAYPEVSFNVTYIPEDELRARYEAASYYGGGPSLLLGSASWAWGYAQNGLVEDVSLYASPAFLATINPVALDTLRSGKQLLGLPYAQQGYVLYRNTAMISQPPDTFTELIASASSATRGGRVGAYLEREAIVSSAGLVGMGGQLMDEHGRPAFNTAQGVAWLDLLADYEQAGLAGMHTNRDLDLFESGKIGYIIEGTWRIDRLVKALGAEHMAIDRWPALDSGQLSGYVQTEAVFLNTNTLEKNRLAALRFMGYLLRSDVQSLLGESGMIPTVLQAAPRDGLVQQAMSALQGGTAWPVADEKLLVIYWNALDEAIQNVFVRGTAPSAALQSAYQVIAARLEALDLGE